MIFSLTSSAIFLRRDKRERGKGTKNLRAMTEKMNQRWGAATGGRTARAETSLQGHLHLPSPSAAYTLAALSHIALSREVTASCSG